MQKKVMAQAVAAVILGMVAGGASASGFQLLEQNASGLGNAYAGSAISAENASVLYYNPAAISMLPGVNVSSGVVALKPSYKFKNDGSSNYPAATGSDGGDAGGVFYLPNLYITGQINSKWSAGIGFNSPFGLRTSYDDDWTGRFQSKMFDIKTYNINPTVAYKVTDKVALGFGLDWQRMSAQYTRALATVASAYQATEVKLDVTNDAWGWNAGMTYKPSETIDIGMSYRSRVTHHLDGSLNSSNQSIYANTNAEVTMTLPDTTILSVSQKLNDRWVMLGDVSRTSWSTVDKVLILSGSGNLIQVLDANFRDTWRFALGGNYKINDRWKWKVGVAYDQSPVRGAEERLVSLPDNNRYWISTGVQWKADEHSTLDFGVAYVWIPKDKIESDGASAYRGTVLGSYVGNIPLVGLQYTASY